MKKIVSAAIFSLIIALVVGITTSTMVHQAFADPKDRHGRCFFNEHGANGCAGDVGGFIETPNGRCLEQKTPFSDFQGAC